MHLLKLHQFGCVSSAAASWTRSCTSANEQREFGSLTIYLKQETRSVCVCECVSSGSFQLQSSQSALVTPARKPWAYRRSLHSCTLCVCLCPKEEPMSTTATQPPAGGRAFPLAPRPLSPCISIPVTSTPTAKEAVSSSCVFTCWLAGLCIILN